MKRLIVILIMSFVSQFVFAQTTSSVPPPPPYPNPNDVKDSTKLLAIPANDTVTSVSGDSKDSTTLVFSEHMPVSAYDFNQYLQQNMKYPKADRAANHQGKVYISFVVEKDGSITNVFVKKSSGYPALDEEALRCLSVMPPWTPGEINGRKVRVEVTQPVNFALITNKPKRK